MLLQEEWMLHFQGHSIKSLRPFGGERMPRRDSSCGWGLHELTVSSTLTQS